MQIRKAADIFDGNTCQSGGTYCANSSPFLQSTTGSGLLCGFWAAGSKVTDYSHDKRHYLIKRRNGQQYNLVTKLGFYFLPPVFKSSSLNQSSDLAATSPSSAAYYQSPAVTQQNNVADSTGFIWSGPCTKPGAINPNCEQYTILTGVHH